MKKNENVSKSKLNRSQNESIFDQNIIKIARNKNQIDKIANFSKNFGEFHRFSKFHQSAKMHHFYCFFNYLLSKYIRDRFSFLPSSAVVNEVKNYQNFIKNEQP